MRVVVVGAGQMGALYGAAAHDNGHDVTFLDVAPAVVDAIEQHGLIIDRQDGRRDTYAIRAVSRASDIGNAPDLALFLTKGWATADAARGLVAITTPRTMIMTLQNGLGNEEALASIFPANPLLIGMSVHTAVTVDVGHYQHTGVRDTVIGPASGSWQPEAHLAAGVFARPDFFVEVKTEPEVRAAQWGKFVLNCASLPTAALTRLPTDALRDMDVAFALMDEVTRETCTIAAAAGITIDPEERVAFQRELFRTAGGRASMLGDVLARRRTEVDSINGEAVRIAERLDVPAPLNRAMYALVKGLERSLEAGEP